MQPRRLPSCSVLFLLLPAVLLMLESAGAQVTEDDFPNELRTNDVEPRISLPEHKRTSPFHSISRTERKSSNDQLVQVVQEAVDTTSRRLLSTDLHTPWQIMHALLGLRQDFEILHEGTPISGLNWVSQGQVFTDEHWFEKTRHGGRAHPYSIPYAFEGHANQFLAILSMCGLDLDHKFGTATGTITMRDMIQNAQMTVSTDDEPTWTLWALSRYLPPSATWRNQNGETWSIEKLVQIQTGKPMQGAACGGTHGLFALAHARNVYLRQNQPLRGVWLQAEYKIRQHINTARMQQNSNGTLSSNFFRERKYDPDFNKRMASAGHILEFLMIALPQKELNERWVRRAIEATARELLDNRKAYVKCSPLYHSVNALNIYLDRVNPRVPAKQLAKGEPEAKTAAVPKRTDDSTAQLKSVPVRSISNPRTITGNSDLTTATDQPDSAENMKAETGKKADKDGWKAAPAERRTPIAVSSETKSPVTAGAGETSELPAPAAVAGESVADSGTAKAEVKAAEPENATSAAEASLPDKEVSSAEMLPEHRSDVPLKSVSRSRIVVTAPPTESAPENKPETTSDSETQDTDAPAELSGADAAATVEPEPSSEAAAEPEVVDESEVVDEKVPTTGDESVREDIPAAEAETSENVPPEDAPALAVTDLAQVAAEPSTDQDTPVESAVKDPPSALPEGINDRFLDSDLDPNE